MKRTLAGMAFSLACLMNLSEAQTMNNDTSALSPKEQQIAAISAHTARGDMPGLRNALTAGLDAGLTLNELKEVLVQMYAYCGFPRSLNALNELMVLAKDRASRGINDTVGEEAGAPPAGKSIDFGTANQTKLCGAPVKGDLFLFAPAIDEFLKAHLFGDIFGRDNMDWKTRELATIAALAAMTGTESQLNSHIRIGKHNGLTDGQVEAILAVSAAAGKKALSISKARSICSLRSTPVSTERTASSIPPFPSEIPSNASVVTPKYCDSSISIGRSGIEALFSHFETVLLETERLCATSSCVSPFAVLSFTSISPILHSDTVFTSQKN